MDKYWFSNGKKYLTSDEITIADLSFACELAQIKAFAIYDEIQKKFPRIFEWLEKEFYEAIPEFKELHQEPLNTLKSQLESFSAKL